MTARDTIEAIVSTGLKGLLEIDARSANAPVTPPAAPGAPLALAVSN
jgi:hypothetical protein